MEAERRALILGSSSRWRRAILKNAGFTFEVKAPDIDEKAIRGLPPDRLVKAIAFAKADALLPRLAGRQALVITCDQVGVFVGTILEKPVDAEQARIFLRGHRGRSLAFYTAVAVTDVETCMFSIAVDVSIVEVDALPDAAIEEAIGRGDVLNSCGAFVLRDPSLAPYVRLTLGTVSSCEGLPLETLRALLAQHGYRAA